MQKKFLMFLLASLFFTPLGLAQVYSQPERDQTISNSMDDSSALIGEDSSQNIEISDPQNLAEVDLEPQPVSPVDEIPQIIPPAPVVIERYQGELCAICFKPVNGINSFEVQSENKIYKTCSLECQKAFNLNPKKSVKKLEFEEETRRRQNAKKK